MAKEFTVFEVDKVYTGETGFLKVEDTKPYLVTARNYRMTKNGMHTYVSLVRLNPRTMKPLGRAKSYLVDYLGDTTEIVFTTDGYDVMSNQPYTRK